MHKRKRLGLKDDTKKGKARALKAEARKRAGKGKPPAYGSADKPT